MTCLLERLSTVLLLREHFQGPRTGLPLSERLQKVLRYYSAFQPSYIWSAPQMPFMITRSTKILYFQTTSQNYFIYRIHNRNNSDDRLKIKKKRIISQYLRSSLNIQIFEALSRHRKALQDFLCIEHYHLKIMDLQSDIGTDFHDIISLLSHILSMASKGRLRLNDLLPFLVDLSELLYL